MMNWKWDELPEHEQELELAADRAVTRSSSVRPCSGCGKKVMLYHTHAYCDDCADRIERGWELDLPDGT
jgi:hypothetical protein